MAQQVKNKQTNFNGLNYISFENIFFSGEMDDFFVTTTMSVAKISKHFGCCIQIQGYCAFHI